MSMSPITDLAPRRPAAATRLHAERLGLLLAQIRQTDIDSLHASFEVPTIYAQMPWSVDAETVIDEADGDAEAQGFEYVLEVALARDLLAGLVGADGHPTEAECVEAVTVYSATGHVAAPGQTPWVSRCLAC